MDENELIPLVLPIRDGFWLKGWWWFKGELPGGSYMTYYCLINGEKKQEIKIDGVDLSVTNKY